MLAIYLALRIVHVTTYNSYRGHNAAFAPEEFMKFFTVMSIFGAFTSSMMMVGLKFPFKTLFKKFGHVTYKDIKYEKIYL